MSPEVEEVVPNPYLLNSKNMFPHFSQEEFLRIPWLKTAFGTPLNRRRRMCAPRPFAFPRGARRRIRHVGRPRDARYGQLENRSIRVGGDGLKKRRIVAQ